MCVRVVRFGDNRLPVVIGSLLGLAELLLQQSGVVQQLGVGFVQLEQLLMQRKGLPVILLFQRDRGKAAEGLLGPRVPREDLSEGLLRTLQVARSPVRNAGVDQRFRRFLCSRTSIERGEATGVVAGAEA